MTWEPLLDVTDESMVQMVKGCEPGTILHRVISRIVTSLGAGPDGIISAFQSAVDDANVMVSGFGSNIY